MFGYSLIKVEDLENLKTARNREMILRQKMCDAYRWFNEFEDISKVINWIRNDTDTHDIIRLRDDLRVSNKKI